MAKQLRQPFVVEDPRAHLEEIHRHRRNPTFPEDCEGSVPLDARPINFLGTVPPANNFDRAAQANALRIALEQGTDKEAVIRILTSHNNWQRREIEEQYNVGGQKLREDLANDLSGRFEDVAVRLLEHPRVYDAIELNKAMKKFGTDEDSLIEILVTRSKDELYDIKGYYQKMFERDLEHDIESDTSGHFRKLLLALAKGREDGMPADVNDAYKEARQLYAAGEAKFGTDEDCFINILTKRSFPQLREIIKQYREHFGCGITKAIKDEMSGNLKKACLAIVQFARNPAQYFADCIHESIDGWGTKDRRLIRQIISRSEIDLSAIKLQYRQRYDESLTVAVKCDTSGYYRDIMLHILEEKTDKTK